MTKARTATQLLCDSTFALREDLRAGEFGKAPQTDGTNRAKPWLRHQRDFRAVKREPGGTGGPGALTRATRQGPTTHSPHSPAGSPDLRHLQKIKTRASSSNTQPRSRWGFRADVPASALPLPQISNPGQRAAPWGPVSRRPEDAQRAGWSKGCQDAAPWAPPPPAPGEPLHKVPPHSNTGSVWGPRDVQPSSETEALTVEV